MSQPVGNETVVENPGQEVTPPAGGENNPNPESTLTHDQALAELAKVRREAAERRVKTRELEEQAKKWQEYEESQKTELQKLQDQLAERDRKLAETAREKTIASLARKYNLEDDDLEFLTGSDEATLETQAEKLANKLGRNQESQGNRRPADLLAGNRGAPVGSANNGNTFSMDEFIRGSARR
jgi:predicted ribosome quality control (RQC) complex YloA/Tae2 family protein